MTCVSGAESASGSLPTVPFYCPVPAARHPSAEELNETTVAWMLRQALDTDEDQRRRLAVCDFGGLTASTMPYGTARTAHPDGQVPRRAVLARRRGLRRVRGDCRSAGPGDVAHHAGDRGSGRPVAVTTLRTRRHCAPSGWNSERYATPQQVRRWTDAMRVYTSGLVWEASWRRSAGTALPRRLRVAVDAGHRDGPFHRDDRSGRRFLSTGPRHRGQPGSRAH